MNVSQTIPKRICKCKCQFPLNPPTILHIRSVFDGNQNHKSIKIDESQMTSEGFNQCIKCMNKKENQIDPTSGIWKRRIPIFVRLKWLQLLMVVGKCGNWDRIELQQQKGSKGRIKQKGDLTQGAGLGFCL